MAYTLDTSIGELLDDPRAKPVLNQYLPGVADNPMLGMVKGMTLNMLLSMPIAAQLSITKEKVEQILKEVNKRV